MTRFISLLFIISLIFVSFSGCGKNEKDNKEISRIASESILQSPQIIQEPGEDPLSPVKYGRDDPFAPITADSHKSRAIERKGLALEGIILDEKQSLAVINGVIVKVGDSTPKGIVTKIGNGIVVIKEGEQEHILRMGGFNF